MTISYFQMKVKKKLQGMAKMFVKHTRTICTLETQGIYSFSVSSTHSRANLTHSCHLPSASVHTKPMKIWFSGNTSDDCQHTQTDQKGWDQGSPLIIPLLMRFLHTQRLFGISTMEFALVSLAVPGLLAHWSLKQEAHFPLISLGCCLYFY